MINRLTFGSAQVTVFPTTAEMFTAAADEFFRIVTTSLAQRGIANIALSGGETPRSLYELIAQRAIEDAALKNIDWRKVHLFFGDERSVPPTDKESNYRMVRESLLSNAALGAARVHRIHAELPPVNAAELYEADLKQHFSPQQANDALSGSPSFSSEQTGNGPNGNGAELPKFDLILLGLGPDGHTASLFPETAALNVNDRWVVPNQVPQQNTTRITFTYPVLNRADEVLFLVVGGGKAKALHRALITRDVPAAQVQPAGKLLWHVDTGAAGELLRK